MTRLAGTRVVSAVAVAVMAMLTVGALCLTSSSPAQADETPKKVYPKLIANDCSSCPEKTGWQKDGCNVETGECRYIWIGP